MRVTTPMSVGRRLFWSLFTLVMCITLFGAASLAGLLGMGRHFQIAEKQYEDLRLLYEIGHRAAAVRLLLNDNDPVSHVIDQQLGVASQHAKRLAEAAGSGDIALPLDIVESRRAIAQLLDEIPQDARMLSDPEALRTPMNRTLGHVAALAKATEGQIIENRREASAQSSRILGAMAAFLGGTVLLALCVGILQYRSIMRPLRALDRAIGDLGAASCGTAIAECGDVEFRRLIGHVNRTGRNLAHFHASMRSQVDAKSRALIRSEQLASIGSLAAGLAHEINTPLGVIAGYAETSLRRLGAGCAPPSDVVQKIERSLRIIMEEAYRCRDITRDLLALAQPSGAVPGSVDVAALLERSITLVRGLPIARDREIVLCVESAGHGLIARGHASEVLQVFINLLTNALEACSPPGGRVLVSGERTDGGVSIEITDNGCGMSEETLAHAFDPFYTDKPKRGLAGCGLGLSVSHAIVQRHQGSLTAHSEGAGRGSTFHVELPAPVDGAWLIEGEACLTTRC